MTLRSEVYFLVGAILYPLWLVAAGCDYLSHRRTDIEDTSGWRESMLHLLQYLCIAPVVVVAALYPMGGAVLAFATVAVLLHTVLAYVDVTYTRRRRFIPRFEQRLHVLMTVLPILAVMLLAFVDARNASPRAVLPSLQLWLIFGGTAVIGGVPVLEELIRTLRATTSSHAPEESPPVH